MTLRIGSNSKTVYHSGGSGGESDYGDDGDDGDGDDGTLTPGGAAAAAAAPAEDATLLRDLDRALAAEGRGIENLLRQTSELRAVAAGEMVMPGAGPGAGTSTEDEVWT